MTTVQPAVPDLAARRMVIGLLLSILVHALILSIQFGRADPVVSVALRSDGSVDEVSIVRSSGRTDPDEAVRRIVRLNARYAAFPPNVPRAST